MKKLLLILAFIPTLTNARDPVIIEKKVVCNDLKVIIENLMKRHGEEPIWIGYKEKDRSKYSLFLRDDGAWTLIQYSGSTACILGAGNDSEVVDLDPPPMI